MDKKKKKRNSKSYTKSKVLKSMREDLDKMMDDFLIKKEAISEIIEIVKIEEEL